MTKENEDQAAAKDGPPGTVQGQPPNNGENGTPPNIGNNGVLVTPMAPSRKPPMSRRAAEEVMESLREVLKSLEKATNRRNPSESGIRKLMRLAEHSFRGAEPYLQLFTQKERRDTRVDVMRVQEKATDVVKKLNPLVETMDAALDLDVPLQGVHTRGSAVTAGGGVDAEDQEVEEVVTNGAKETEASERLYPNLDGIGDEEEEEDSEDFGDDEGKKNNTVSSEGSGFRGFGDPEIAEAKDKKIQEMQRQLDELRKKVEGPSKAAPVNKEESTKSNASTAKGSWTAPKDKNPDDTQSSRGRGTGGKGPTRGTGRGGQNWTQNRDQGSHSRSEGDRNGYASSGANRPRYPCYYGQDFINMKFGENWPVPTIEEANKKYTVYDFHRNAPGGGLLPIFSENILDYPSWQSTICQSIHVQNRPVMQKCLALDSCVSDRLRSEMFTGLGTSAYEYWLRTQRLDDRFGGEQRQMAALMYKLDCLRNVEKSTQALQQAVYVLQHIIHTPFWTAKGAEMIGMLMHKMSTSVRRSFADFCVTNNCKKQDLKALHRFLDERRQVEQVAEMCYMMARSEKGSRKSKSTPQKRMSPKIKKTFITTEA